MATKLVAFLVRLHNTSRLERQRLHRRIHYQLLIRIVHAQTLPEFKDFAREKGTARIGARRLVLLHVEGLEVGVLRTNRLLAGREAPLQAAKSRCICRF